MPIKHVAIVGAGIGGLAAALAIRQAGLSVSVYDQASRLEPLGASLTLWPNAMRCLRALGVAEPLLRAGARFCPPRRARCVATCWPACPCNASTTKPASRASASRAPTYSACCSKRWARNT
ncbi:FAD-dependent monooxygenase [Achromobacter xylosoxidans]